MRVRAAPVCAEQRQTGTVCGAKRGNATNRGEVFVLTNDASNLLKTWLLPCYTPAMTYRATAALTFALLAGSATNLPTHQPQQKLTPAPHGPFHVDGNRVIDAKGRPFLMRGTQLTEFHPQTMAHDNRSGLDFGEHSATSLSAIRLRFNMNTVRLPLDANESTRPAYFSQLAKVVRRATDIDLLVVLAADGSADFWSRCAAAFKSYPNVMFDASGSDSAEAVRAIRAAGAAQPVLVKSTGALLDDPNLIYSVAPQLASLRTDAERDAQFGALSARVPMATNGLDFALDNAAACSEIPADPTAASALIESTLTYFDTHQVSWTASVYQAGKLVKDLSLQDATSLENGWTCGPQSYPSPGIGRVVEAHLRSNEERGLFVVSAGGGPDVARGGFAIGYGPVMAAHDSWSKPGQPQFNLGKIAVQVTDSRGVTHPAAIFYATAGWGQINFVIPPAAATGPARMTIVREDGSRESTQITIADTAPGFWTGVSCRGPAQGVATQVFPDGRKASMQIQECKPGNCWPNAIPVTAGATTRVSMKASGFRYAGSPKDIVATVGGVRVPVISFGPAEDPGVDQVTIEIPASLRGKGVLDLICHLNGRVSNAVQINIGG